MTDNLIGPKPEGPKYSTPWKVSRWGNLEDADGNTLYFPASEVVLNDSRKLGPAIVEAVNAYYGADPMGAMGELERTEKDTRIVVLEGRAQVAEELVKKLQKEAGARNERWAIMVREADKRNDRIAELQEAFEEAERLADKRLLQRQAAKKRAQSAEARKVEAEERAEAAEVDRDWYRSVAAHNKDAAMKAEDSKEDAEKRAEAAIDEMHGTEKFAAAMRERAEKAEARVKELEAENARLWDNLADRDSELDDTPITFTAPDGRVFRVGQRVWCTAEREYGTVASRSGSVARIDYPRDCATSSLSNLRRVWDGSEEPDVPVGTVLRDKHGYLIEQMGDREWFHDDGLRAGPSSWIWPDTFDGPYVEVLDGDE